MSNLAKGKYAKAISDRSGMEFPYQEMVREWNGSLVHVSEFEAKQPQLEPSRYTGDPQGLMNARPARTEPATQNLLPSNSFSLTSGSANVTVTEPNHGRSNSDTVRFRDVESVGGIAATTISNASGFTITKVDDNNYTFGAGTNASFSGTGGGGLASAGPVTIVA